MIYSAAVLPYDGQIADVVIFYNHFSIVERFLGVPKQRKIQSLDAGLHPIFCCTCTRPGAISRLLNVLGSTISCEAYE